MLKKAFRKKNAYAEIIVRITGVYPRKISIYQQAFLHKSILQNSQLQPFESNERLEFLGDAILDSVVSNYIYHQFPKKNEGYLTKLRAKLVSRATLNNLGIKIGLKELMQSNLDRASKSIYGDVLEALIGAIYIDQGYAVAQKFVERNLFQHHIDIEQIMNTETNFKGWVLEWCQQQKLEVAFQVLKKTNRNMYEVILIINGETKGTGIAYTKKQAEQIAAEVFYKEVV